MEGAQSGANRDFFGKGKHTNVFALSAVFVDVAVCCLVCLFFGVAMLVEVSRALRVFPAETRLTVYRRSPVFLRSKVKNREAK